jgi:hypothetical protein
MVCPPPLVAGFAVALGLQARNGFADQAQVEADAQETCTGDENEIVDHTQSANGATGPAAGGRH